MGRAHRDEKSAGDPGGGDRGGARLDRWLWSVRLFKTRSLAATACRKSRVRMAGGVLKPSKVVRAGEVYQVGCRDLVMTVRVLALPATRVAARLVPGFMEDLTPPEQYQEAARRSCERRGHAADERLTARPTKRDLREIRRWLGRGDESGDE